MVIPKEEIRIVFIDDHPLIHMAVRNLLNEQAHMTVVGEGSAGEHLFPLLEEHKPDVLILDLSMPQYVHGGEERFEVLPALKTLGELAGETKVIILSQNAHRVIIEQAFRYGVNGYLLKGDDLSLNLADAVEAVYRGGVYFSKKISEALFHSRPSEAHGLTPRQLEIIMAIAKQPDASYAQLSDQLGIKEGTFKGHLNKAFKSLGVTNATAAIIHCMQAGLIPFSFEENGRLKLGDL